MQNKKGFTLVELLAVIVILAVVSIVAIPIVINLIEESKKGALKDSVEGLTKAADMYYFQHMKNAEDGVQIEIVNNEQTAPQEPRLNYKGEVKNGFVLISYDGKVAVCADDGKYFASRALDSKAIITDIGSCTNEFDDELNTFVTVGSANFVGLRLNVRALSSKPNAGDKAAEGTIGVVTSDKITGYYAAPIPPVEPKEGMVWVVTNNNAENFIGTKTSRVGVSYALQYKDDNWELKDSYLYNDGWTQTNNYEGTEYEWTFDYTGKYQTFKAPFNGYYGVELWGASGANSNNAIGGKGAYTYGEIYLNKDEEIYIYVGQTGVKGSASVTWNGGGGGANNAAYGGSGGGATDVRTVPTTALTTWNQTDSLRTRIMVAAGGGASGYEYGAHVGNSYGGAGGGLEGYRGENSRASTSSAQTTLALGGTQIAAGRPGAGDICSAGGSGFGYGSTLSSCTYGGGGGGGWYGGGAGGTSSDSISSGAGGSSYISGHDGCISLDNELKHYGSMISLTGKYFLNTLMIDGNGYKWTDRITEQVSMPTHDGKSKMTGNTGNGFAKITFKRFDALDNDTYIELGAKQETTWRYDYMGYYQKFTTPKAGTYKFELWGAQGSVGTNNAPGGKGAYTSGEIVLKKGQTLYIYVGRGGWFAGTSTTWNGGGGGSSSGGNGGGATDVRVTATTSLDQWNQTDSLMSRIMVAAGGGAGGYEYGVGIGNSYGGAGGGLIGYGGENSRASNSSARTTLAGGGTQTSRGQRGIGNLTTTYEAGFGYGGTLSGKWGGGGGSGWYGGGAGATNSDSIASGGGGSSYISGHEGCIGLQEDGIVNSSESDLEKSYSYTGFVFKKTEMIDGLGYRWTTQKGSSVVNMPSHTSNNRITGNTGNGYARITFVK